MRSPDYRLILKQALEERLNKNPSYSLRAFARDLKVSASHLSGVLRGKLGLSRESAKNVGKILGMTKTEVEDFVDLVDAKHARSINLKKMALKRIRDKSKLKKQTPIHLNQFQYISDWYHFALLELLYLREFKPDIAWMAHHLKITLTQAKDAIAHLKRLNLIKESLGTLKSTEDWSEVQGDIPSSSIRNFHRDILKKALQALDQQTIKQRDARSTVMAVRREKLEEAKHFLRQFHDEFCIKVGESELYKFNKEDVYCLSTHFFSLTPHLNNSKLEQE
jgi:uncharacterized protein (TIGR02147 family)